jgi:hypothetical protein
MRNYKPLSIRIMQKLQSRYDILKIKRALEMEDLAWELKEEQKMREKE